MLPEDPSSVVDVWQWVAIGLTAAVVAQWAYMITSNHSARQERQAFYDKVADAISENSKVIQDLLIWLRSGGK